MTRFCQSCGMPVKQDPENGGTNGDGSKGADYCSYCYRNGAFTSAEIKTAADMQAFCVAKLKQMGTPALMAWLFTRSIPKLKRWRNI
ncbi:MAG: hypothetical protein EA384_05020 [Spirochaetaceae bacterium]|nr:MAG: hypothetical protein EA384_05020 [Spirochaetaceae bacterium]